MIGCGKTPTPAAPPAFQLPSVGDSTDGLLRVGDPLPEIRTFDLAGNSTVLREQLHGEGYTLLVFWSTWCEFCMFELPHEVELANQYASRGLRVIGINADATPEIAEQAVREYSVPWLNVFEGPDRSISSQLGIQQWPALILLGPDGKVISATQQLRGISAHVSSDGSAHQQSGLDRTLQHLLDNRPADGTDKQRISDRG
jgi:thiol-disulfide isomerase/thioredoxin